MTTLQTRTIARIKAAMRAAILAHGCACEHLDCGANMAAVISPHVGSLAREINGHAARLRELDPDFPASFINYPEGT